MPVNIRLAALPCLEKQFTSVYSFIVENGYLQYGGFSWQNFYSLLYQTYHSTGTYKLKKSNAFAFDASFTKFKWSASYSRAKRSKTGCRRNERTQLEVRQWRETEQRFPCSLRRILLESWFVNYSF